MDFFYNLYYGLLNLFDNFVNKSNYQGILSCNTNKEKYCKPISIRGNLFRYSSEKAFFASTYFRVQILATLRLLYKRSGSREEIYTATELSRTLWSFLVREYKLVIIQYY